ncbi:pectin lyase-like protein [Piromyces finnis]|uniref:Pectin lyase-like protein n=1 Tax=Piromyces finnis TaxID=1754191 RepID=A0A1Y1V1H9_9FUNG|nr:pectin lyase-like protein [Piromyces finnis]|eukprot:ORX45033.1 pectin lyase-like protein [Piromyces finnis]
MKFISLSFSLLLGMVVQASSPIGWGKDTTGGEGGIEYHVKTYHELKEALVNHGKPNDPKIIYIESFINGLAREDGSLIDFESLIPGYSFEKYVSCFTKDAKAYLETEECQEITRLRSEGRILQDQQVNIDIPPNTSIIGHDYKAGFKELSLQVKNTDNIIIKNLYIEAPNDYFSKFVPTDGVNGTWNSEYDAISINNSTNVWIDNCYLSDGSTSLDTQPIVFGQHIESHDGLIDVINGSTKVTLSNNRFENHKKGLLIGNSDSRKTDRDRLCVTLCNNVFINCNERLPRVRFGKVHTFNNYYYAETFHPAYPSYTVNNYFHSDDDAFPQYFIGLGVESNVVSERNSFNYIGNDDIPDSDDVIVYSYGGYIFHDHQSEYNGKLIDINGLAEQSFKFKVQNRIAQDLAKGKKHPDWINATFTTDTFIPSEYYDYELKDIDYVNDLINHVPSWMFSFSDEEDLSDSEEEEDSIQFGDIEDDSVREVAESDDE